MTPHELTEVVARIQAGDNRAVDRVTLAHWQETIGHLDKHDALAAVVMHFRESTAYLMPAHIIANVRRIREERSLMTAIEDIVTPMPRPDNEDAMTAAWDDPDEFAHQVAIYNQQLEAAGYPPVDLTRS